jgi:hypothetical protein
MAGGDYGNIRGNKAKTSSGQKHRHQELTVVRFVPFVGDEDGRKGVVTVEVDLKRTWYGRPEILRLPSSLWLRDNEKRWGAAIGRLWSCEWKELEGGGMWVANPASELVVLAWQPWRVAAQCVLARRRRKMAFYRRGASWRGGNAVVQSSASRGMARTERDVRRRGRPMVRGGAASQCVRAWRVAPTKAHPRRAQEPEHSAWTDGHQHVSTCARTVAEPTGRGRGDVARGVHVPARDISV